MNVNKIAKLVKEDDATLVIAVNRWTQAKQRKDPIPGILWESKYDSINFWGLMFLLLMVIEVLVLLRCPRPLLSVIGISIGIIVIVIMVTAVKLCLISREKPSEEEMKSAEEFRKALSIVERIYIQGGAAHDIWEDKLQLANDWCFQYLCEQSDKLQKLERIPWRKKEEEKFRKQFDWEFDAVTCVACLPLDRKKYFVRPVKVPIIMDTPEHVT